MGKVMAGSCRGVVVGVGWRRGDLWWMRGREGGKDKSRCNERKKRPRLTEFHEPMTKIRYSINKTWKISRTHIFASHLSPLIFHFHLSSFIFHFSFFHLLFYFIPHFPLSHFFISHFSLSHFLTPSLLHPFRIFFSLIPLSSSSSHSQLISLVDS